tara:strand:- start:186 stop:440 length:255 start_codon:yes stop_codon:yes gene_type:complete
MEKSMKSQAVEQAKIIGKSQIEQDIEIKIIKKDIETIRDNHLVHLQQDVRRVENKVDKIDMRIWGILIIIIASTIGTVLAGLFT